MAKAAFDLPIVFSMEGLNWEKAHLTGTKKMKLFYQILITCDLYYKHITIINDDSIMTLQVVASPTIIILTTLEASFMPLANIYSRGITRNIFIVQATDDFH